MRGCLLLSMGALVLANLGVLVYAASVGEHLPGEESFSVWVQSWRTSWLDALMMGLSTPGFRFVAASMVISTWGFLFFKGMRKEAILILGGTFTAALVTTIIKIAVARPRPPDDLVYVFGDPDGFAFPSGHVMHYMVYLGLLVFITARTMRPSAARLALQATFVFAMLGVGVSRVYVGAHWVGDVVAAYTIGAILVAAAILVWMYWHRV